MSSKKEKLKSLYNYLLKEGFENSIEKIALQIGVVPATLYNRYQSRKGIETAAIQYWLEEISQKCVEKHPYTNNSIENLLLFIHELNLRKNEAEHFYTKAIENNEIYAIKETIFPIIEAGIETKHFKEEGSSDEYLNYFIYTLTKSILVSKKIESRFFYYLIAPILTEIGIKAIEEIDLVAFFK